MLLHKQILSMCVHECAVIDYSAFPSNEAESKTHIETQLKKTF